MSFGKDIRNAVNKRYKPGYKKVTTGSLIALSSSIIKMTPVQTGRARGNWFAAIDAPKDGTTQSKTVNFAAVTNTINDSVGSTFYFTNNLPYIKVLEFGTFSTGSSGDSSSKITGEGFSKQAPAGMVRVSIANYQKNIDNAINKLT